MYELKETSKSSLKSRDEVVGQKTPSGNEVDEAPILEAGLPTSPPKLARWRVISLTVMMTLTYFVGGISIQALILNIPRMAIELEVSELQVQWTVSAYGLAYGCALLLSGRLADVLGSKMCYLVGLGIYFTFNLISAFVKTFIPLCVLRALAGIGNALFAPAGFAVINRMIVTEPERTLSFSAFGLGGPIGSAGGAMIGGLVAGIDRPFAFSYLFYIFAGLAAVPFVLCLWAADWDWQPDIRARLAEIDYFGGLLVTLAVTAFLFSLNQSGVVGWQAPYVPVLFVISLALFPACMLWFRYLETETTRPPLIKYSIFTKNGYRVSAVIACSFLIVICIGGWVFAATIWYQNLKGMSALMNAVHVLPCAIFGIVVGFFAMWAADRVSPWYLFAGGAILSSVCSLLYAVVPPDTNFFACEFIAQLCLPWGIDLIVCVGNVLIANLVDADEAGVGSALNQTSFAISSALATNLSSLIINLVEQHTGDLLNAVRAAMWFNAASALAVIPVAWVFVRKIRRASQVKEVLAPRVGLESQA